MDYKNTTFRCWYYEQTRHLGETCPQARSQPKKKNGQFLESKISQPYDSSLPKDEKEESKAYFPPSKIEEVNKKEIKLKNDGIK